MWETPPVGSRGSNFLNAALLIRTTLTSGLLKSLVLRPIEIQMGRVRTANKNAPRPIDLDILVRKVDFPRAYPALIGAGYTPEIPPGLSEIVMKAMAGGAWWLSLPPACSPGSA